MHHSRRQGLRPLTCLIVSRILDRSDVASTRAVFVREATIKKEAAYSRTEHGYTRC
jgi:hypothetical protein